MSMVYEFDGLCMCMRKEKRAKSKEKRAKRDEILSNTRVGLANVANVANAANVGKTDSISGAGTKQC